MAKDKCTIWLVREDSVQTCDEESNNIRTINRGQPQHPVTHKGSMVFSEHGRLAQMNPLVLMIMFNIRAPDKSTWQRTYGPKNTPIIKPTAVLRLAQQFTEYGETYDPIDTLIEIAYLVAQAIFLTHKSRLSNEETRIIPAILKRQRKMLQGFFLAAGPQRKKYASVPNIHVALHYQQDITNYGTLRNVAVMVGEQKHKIYKSHAPHTNSYDTELQLLKVVNISQTIRFMLDGVYPDHRLSMQIQQIAVACPVLCKKFLGTSRFHEVESGNVDTEGSPFFRCQVSIPIKTREIPNTLREKDEGIIIDAWSRIYGVHISATMINPRFAYWKKITCQYNDYNHIRPLSMPLSAFVVHLRSQELYKIIRIVSMTVGTLQRAFIIGTKMIRARTEELAIAPYNILTPLDVNGSHGGTEVLSICELKPINLHVVERTDSSWWWNCYVTHFL